MDASCIFSLDVLAAPGLWDIVVSQVFKTFLTLLMPYNIL